MDIPTSDHGLKWFGEGFDGFPKRLPDDCVEYIIDVIDKKQQDTNAYIIRSRLNQILKASNELKANLLKDYIWEREPFELKIHPQPSSAPTTDQSDPPPNPDRRTPYLKGCTNFGDSIADEWLIVYLLLELSKQFPDAWIRVYDTDGEFLLIEAAGALPKWLNPDIAENRVWISNGHLRIIPHDSSSSTTSTRNLTAQAALDFITATPDKLIISPFIEDEAFHRLQSYPAAISSSLHHSLLTIPRKLAYILHKKPTYISPATESFYLRDPIALRPLSTKDTSTLLFPPGDFVTVSVMFTKVGFAQLRSQIFDAPPAWTGIAPKLKAGDAKAEMGMKVTCGFEMMMRDPQLKDKREVREICLLLEDMEADESVLPSDEEIANWERREDDEKWLDIDYNDFEAELSGRRGTNGQRSMGGAGKGFGDAAAQDNLRKMVSRFEDFLNDDTAGADGVDDDDVGDGDDSDASTDELAEGEDKDASFDEAEFERAMKEMMGMPPEEMEKSGLLDEARKLALEDAEEGDEGVDDEDEEMKKVMELMEQELKGHGALELNDGVLKKKMTGKAASKGETEMKKKTVFFGPERPPGMQMAKTNGDESADEEVGPGDGELSSDDEEFNDVDLGLAKNMLSSFSGQAGLSGPAGNLMRAMGINMPRDEGGDED